MNQNATSNSSEARILGPDDSEAIALDEDVEPAASVKRGPQNILEQLAMIDASRDAAVKSKSKRKLNEHKRKETAKELRLKSKILATPKNPYDPLLALSWSRRYRVVEAKIKRSHVIWEDFFEWFKVPMQTLVTMMRKWWIATCEDDNEISIGSSLDTSFVWCRARLFIEKSTGAMLFYQRLIIDNSPYFAVDKVEVTIFLQFD